MQFDLIKQRVIAFLWGLGTLIVGAVLTVVLSTLTGPEFQALVIEHFGEGTVSALIFLVVQQIVAHLRNTSVVASYTNSLGSTREKQPPTLI